MNILIFLLITLFFTCCSIYISSGLRQTSFPVLRSVCIFILIFISYVPSAYDIVYEPSSSNIIGFIYHADLVSIGIVVVLFLTVIDIFHKRTLDQISHDIYKNRFKALYYIKKSQKYMKKAKKSINFEISDVDTLNKRIIDIDSKRFKNCITIYNNKKKEIKKKMKISQKNKDKKTKKFE